MTLYKFLDISKDKLDDIIDNKSKHYLSYPIRKKSGKRRYIDAPQESLKVLQEKILKNILYLFSAHPIAHGFTKNKNPITNARIHVGAEIVVCVDILNFFNSIKSDRVERLLEQLFKKKNPFPGAERKNIQKQIVELITYRGRVPQGAPTSPALSNLVCLKMDKQLKDLAQEFEFSITRYADDITASDKINSNLGEVIPKINRIIKKYGFKLNFSKTRVKRQSRRMMVTGVVVNQKTNVPKQNWRNIRAQLHNYERDNINPTSNELEILRGHIEWIKNVNPERGQEFIKKLEIILKNTSSISNLTA